MSPKQFLSMIWFDPNAFCCKPVFVEIGANSGRVSTELLSRYGGLCHAYEPGVIGDKIKPVAGLTVFRKAVWDKDGTIEFCDLPKQPQSSSVFARTSRRGPACPHKVECVSIETALAPFEQVDFVNLDAEGAEWGMLMGECVVAFKKVNQICIEFHTEFCKSTVDEAIKRLFVFAGLRCTIVGMPYDTRPIVWGGRY